MAAPALPGRRRCVEDARAAARAAIALQRISDLDFQWPRRCQTSSGGTGLSLVAKEISDGVSGGALIGRRCGPCSGGLLRQAEAGGGSAR